VTNCSKRPSTKSATGKKTERLTCLITVCWQNSDTLTLMFPLGSKPSSWLMSSSMVLCTSLSPPAPSSNLQSSNKWCFGTALVFYAGPTGETLSIQKSASSTNKGSTKKRKTNSYEWINITAFFRSCMNTRLMMFKRERMWSQR
jgi:hypothetical protein